MEFIERHVRAYQFCRDVTHELLVHLLSKNNLIRSIIFFSLRSIQTDLHYVDVRMISTQTDWPVVRAVMMIVVLYVLDQQIRQCMDATIIFSRYIDISVISVEER